MPAIAKVFVTGHSQAIRLPKAFRVSVSEMWIAKNEITGEITLRPKDDDQRMRNIESLFKMIADDPLPEDFLSDSTRRNEAPRNPLEPWIEAAQSGGAEK